MRIKLLAAALLAGALPLAASAGPIAGQFSGTVYGLIADGASVPGGIVVGSTVTGSFQFENIGQAPYEEIEAGVEETRYFSYSDGSFLRIDIGSSVWEASGLGIGVRDNSTAIPSDMLQLFYNSGSYLFDPAFPPAISFPGVPAGVLNASFGFALFDTYGALDLLSSRNLPSSASEINLAGADSRSGSIFGNTDGAGAIYGINFSIDSISVRDVPRAVPEPGTLPLLATALLAGCLIRQRRWAGPQRQA